MWRNDDDNDTVMNWLLARGTVEMLLKLVRAVKIGSKVTLSKNQCNVDRVDSVGQRRELSNNNNTMETLIVSDADGEGLLARIIRAACAPNTGGSVSPER